MTLRKALCKKLITEEMVASWASLHNTTVKAIRRSQTIGVVVYAFMYTALAGVVAVFAWLFILIASSIVRGDVVDGPTAATFVHLLIYSMVTLATAVLAFGIFAAKNMELKLMVDFEQLYKTVVGDEPDSGKSHPFSLTNSVQLFLDRQVLEIKNSERIMDDTAKSYDKRTVTAINRKEAKTRFDEWHRKAFDFGLVKSKSEYCNIV